MATPARSRSCCQADRRASSGLSHRNFSTPPSTPASPTVFCLACLLLKAVAIPSLLPGAGLSPSGQSPMWLHVSESFHATGLRTAVQPLLPQERRERPRVPCGTCCTLDSLCFYHIRSPASHAATCRTLQAADAAGSCDSLELMGWSTADPPKGRTHKSPVLCVSACNCAS